MPYTIPKFTPWPRASPPAYHQRRTPAPRTRARVGCPLLRGTPPPAAHRPTCAPAAAARSASIRHQQLPASRGTKAAADLAPSSVRIGMFCKLGFEEDNVRWPRRLVEAGVQPPGARVEQRRKRVHVRALQLASWRYSSTCRTISWSPRQFFPARPRRGTGLPFLRASPAPADAARRRSTSPSCCERVMLKRPPRQPVDLRRVSRAIWLPSARQPPQLAGVDAQRRPVPCAPAPAPAAASISA